MQEIRYDAGSTTHEGKMWVIGGNDEASHCLLSSEIIDPLESNMISNSVDLPEALCSLSIIRLNSTTSFLIAGAPENQLTSNRTYYFNHNTNNWTKGPDLISGRWSHTAGFIKDRVTHTEHLVVVGGHSKLSSTLDSVEIMFNNENEWMQGTNLVQKLLLKIWKTKSKLVSRTSFPGLTK